ncbi:Ig-like domain-containing protein, partial [Vibrio vulnificus]|nr:Ig-like domain-containing protein [Vibrio vulnificus]
MDFTAFLAGASLTAGRIVVLGLDGQIKILAPGQKIAPGELVIETLEETDVTQIRIGTENGEKNITDDIQQIFAALEQGQDPTQLGDEFAAAAGEAGGSSLVAGVSVSRTGAELLASTDFSTQGLQALGLSEAQSLSLFDLFNDSTFSSATTLEPNETKTLPSLTVTLVNDSGLSNSDLLTNDGAHTVAGVIEGATVEYFVDGEWTSDTPAPVEGENTIIVRQTDAAGNTSGSSTLNFTLDTSAEAGTVTVAPITSDDVITETEKNQTITVTGSATGGDIKTGDIVTAIINGNEYKGSVSEDGSWELSVSGSDLAVDTAFEVTVNSTDAAGNEVTSKGESVHRFDDTPIIVNIDIDPITEDSVINASESQSDIAITGTVSGEEFEQGTVTLIVNGKEFSGQVVDGRYEIDVPGSELLADSDKQVTAVVDVVNSKGQIGSSTSTEVYFVDTSSLATIRVNPITSDDVINFVESQSNVTVSGRVGFDAKAGDLVSMTINGTIYTATVLANKTWSVEVSGTDLANDNSFVATVTGLDSAGNPYSASTTSI